MLSLSVLASVKVASELEALKKTAGHALNALGESRESAAAKAKSATSMLTSGTSASTATSTSMSTGDAVETEDDAAIPTGKLDLFNDIAALLDDMDRKMNISHAEVRTNQTKPSHTKPQPQPQSLAECRRHCHGRSFMARASHRLLCTYAR